MRAHSIHSVCSICQYESWGEGTRGYNVERLIDVLPLVRLHPPSLWPSNTSLPAYGHGRFEKRQTLVAFRSARVYVQIRVLGVSTTRGDDVQRVVVRLSTVPHRIPVFPRPRTRIGI